MKNSSKWMECCIRHDYAYWKGGTLSEREQADNDLKQCVSDLGESQIAFIMHMGVRFGGAPFYPTWYRWGYGWPYARGYSEITDKERSQIQARMIELRELIDEFIEEKQE